jgi:NADPH:quinone reductase
VQGLKQILISNFGGSDSLQYVDSDIPVLSPGQVLVKVVAAGVNFIDIYQRQGSPFYDLTLPFVPGLEGAGVIEEVGSQVTKFKVGQSVAWLGVLGSYRDYHAIDQEKLVAVEDDIDLKVAAAVMLQGTTAHYLTHSTFPIKKGDVALVHAAAGGTGRLLCQFIVNLGGTVIATTSSEEKAQLVRDIGVTHVIRYDQEDVLTKVKEFTGGKGVDVVYDGVGAKTFDQSLRCLKPRSMMVLFGAASGPVPPFELQRLNSGGSLFITRPTIAHHVATNEELTMRVETIFGWIRSKKLEVRIGGAFPLSDAPRAHEALASGQTTGKLLLIP